MCESGIIVNDLDIPKNLLDYEYGFHTACLCGRLDVVKKLYNDKIDLRKYNDIILRYSCRSGNYELFKQILKWCPNILHFISMCTIQQCLIGACKKGSFNIIRDIINNSKHLNLKFKNHELLYWAIKYNYIKIVQIILDNLGCIDLSNKIDQETWYTFLELSSKYSNIFQKIYDVINIHPMNTILLDRFCYDNINTIDSIILRNALLLDKNIQLDYNNILINAIITNNIEIVKYIISNDKLTHRIQYYINIAVRENRYNITKYLYYNMDDILDIENCLYDIKNIKFIKLFSKNIDLAWCSRILLQNMLDYKQPHDDISQLVNMYPDQLDGLYWCDVKTKNTYLGLLGTLALSFKICDLM